MLNRTSLIVLLVFVIGTLLACTTPSPAAPPASTTDVPTLVPPSALSAASARPTLEPPDSDVQRITLERAKAAYDEGAAVFVDVRDPSAYALGHIPGAVLMDLSEVKARLGELDPNSWIITYCT